MKNLSLNVFKTNSLMLIKIDKFNYVELKHQGEVCHLRLYLVTKFVMFIVCSLCFYTYGMNVTKNFDVLYSF